MNVELIQYLVSGVVTVALCVAVLETVRKPMIRAELRRLQRRAGDSLEPADGPADGSGPAGGGCTDQPADRSADAGTGRTLEAGPQGVPAPGVGKGYDPRPQEDRARRRIAYHLIALLAVMIFSLLAMVAFGVVEVGDVDKFGVIVAPIVTLVTAATSSYFANRRAK